MTTGTPRILFVGTFVENRDMPYPQARLLSQLLGLEGYETACVSGFRNRLLRLIHICVRVLLGRYDLIMAQIFSGRAFVYFACAAVLAKLRRKRCIGFLRGGNLPGFLAGKPSRRRFLMLPQRLVAPSGFLRDEMERLGIPALVIPNVIRIERYTYRQRSAARPRILWVRRYAGLYNPEMAVRVARELIKHRPDASLTMAGGGDRSFVGRLVRDEGLESAVTLLGFLSKEEIDRLGQRHDIFINTSRVDNMPVTVLEAMAMGLPVVSTDVGGLPRFLEHGRNALLVANDDHRAMAGAVLALLDDNELCSMISLAGRQTAAGCSWQSVRPRLLSLVEGVIGTGKPTPSGAAASRGKETAPW